MVANLKSLVVPIADVPKPDLSWIGSLGDTLGGALQNARTDASFNNFADRIGGGSQAPQQSGGFLSRLLGGPQQAAAPTGRAPVIPVSRGPIPDAYYSSIRSAESGGNDAARNPRSSATGRYQFTTGTWNGLMQSHPELGLTADGRLDPNQQERAIRAFTQANAQSLSAAGVPVDPGSLYAAHFLGAGGAARVLTQPDDSPISNYLDAGVVQANPFLDGMTVGQFKQWAASKGGNANGGYSAPSSAADAVTAMANGSMPSGGQPLAFADGGSPNGGGNLIAQGVTPVTRGSVDPSLIQYMLRDRNLRETGLKLWAANVQGQNPQEPWQFINLPDGTLARANQQTGAVERLGQFAKPQEQSNVLTAEEKTSLGLPANGAFQRDSSGKITQIGGGGVSVNVDSGTIPAGYQAVRDADGRLLRYEPVPGGPADNSRQRAAQSDSKETITDVVTQAAQRARDAVAGATLSTGGLTGKVAGALLPGSNAAEVRRQVAVLKSNATIENLNSMRQQSPTGGALGSVTESENAMLAAKAGALDPDSPNFLRDLDDYERTLLRIVHGKEVGDAIFNQTRPQKPEAATDDGPVPEGVDPDVWSVMTPDERALWQR